MTTHEERAREVVRDLFGHYEKRDKFAVTRSVITSALQAVERETLEEAVAYHRNLRHDLTKIVEENDDTSERADRWRDVWCAVVQSHAHAEEHFMSLIAKAEAEVERLKRERDEAREVEP